jgi:hypothetical protein
MRHTRANFPREPKGACVRHFAPGHLLCLISMVHGLYSGCPLQTPASRTQPALSSKRIPGSWRTHAPKCPVARVFRTCPTAMQTSKDGHPASLRTRGLAGSDRRGSSLHRKGDASHPPLGHSPPRNSTAVEGES